MSKSLGSPGSFGSSQASPTMMDDIIPMSQTQLEEFLMNAQPNLIKNYLNAMLETFTTQVRDKSAVQTRLQLELFEHAKTKRSLEEYQTRAAMLDDQLTELQFSFF